MSQKIEFNNAEELAREYAFQKWKALDRSGAKRDLESMLGKSGMYTKYTKPLAQMLNNYGLQVSAALVMEALFVQARKQKHFDGPYPNSLSSWKYVKGAVASFLEMPVEAAVEFLSTERTLSALDADYEKACVRMAEARHPQFLSSIPPEYKLKFMLDNSRDPSFLLEEVLALMTENPMIRVWTESRVGSYTDLAARHNKQKNTKN